MKLHYGWIRTKVKVSLGGEEEDEPKGFFFCVAFWLENFFLQRKLFPPHLEEYQLYVPCLLIVKP